MDFDQFYELTLREGFESSGIWAGIYRAKVVSNADPTGSGRVQIACIAAGHPEEGLTHTWVSPLFDAAGKGMGSFWPPISGSLIRVFFSTGKSAKPVGYLGGWFTPAGTDYNLPKEFAYTADGSPEKRGWVTRAGHSIVFNDEPGKESVMISWHQPDPGDPSLTDPTQVADRTKGKSALVQLDKAGSVLLMNANGSLVTLDAKNNLVLVVDENGNSITLDKNGIKLVDKAGNFLTMDAGTGDMNLVSSGNINLTGKSVNLNAGGVFLGQGAAMSGVIGEALMTWLASHTHTVNGPAGPTSPPVMPPTPTILSQSVKIK